MTLYVERWLCMLRDDFVCWEMTLYVERWLCMLRYDFVCWEMTLYVERWLYMLRDDFVCSEISLYVQRWLSMLLIMFTFIIFGKILFLARRKNVINVDIFKKAFHICGEKKKTLPNEREISIRKCKMFHMQNTDFFSSCLSKKKSCMTKCLIRI